MKICNKCNIEKDIIEFPIRKTSKTGYRNICKKCFNKQKYKSSIGNTKRLDWKLENKDKISEYKKKWRDKNKDYIINYRINYLETRNIKNKERLESDYLYALKCRIRGLIKITIRNRGFVKKSKSFDILGCDLEFFVNYLESKFEPWMNWNNCGKYNGEFNYGWDLDHIIPISKANTEEEVLLLNNYLNFQPLCSKINRDVKRDN